MEPAVVRGGGLGNGPHWIWYMALVAVIVAVVGTAIVRGWSRARAISDNGNGVFRSGQLSAEALGQFIEEYGIRTVVNLRGRAGGREWYAAELQTCGEHGVTHHTVTFSVDDWAPRSQVVRLLEIVNRAERPMMLHCRRGVDRTGLGAVVCVLAGGGSLAAAQEQLSLVDGHFCRQGRCPQHRFLLAYREYLTHTGTATSAGVFEIWVKEHYCPAPYDAALSTMALVPGKLAPGAPLSLDIRVENRGALPWVLSSGRFGVRLGLRIFGPFDAYPEDLVAVCRDRSHRGKDLARSGMEDSLIGPGDARRLPIAVRAPEVPGLYLLQADMVQEHEHWFCEMGWPGLFWELQVTN